MGIEEVDLVVEGDEHSSHGAPNRVGIAEPYTTESEEYNKTKSVTRTL